MRRNVDTERRFRLLSMVYTPTVASKEEPALSKVFYLRRLIF